MTALSRPAAASMVFALLLAAGCASQYPRNDTRMEGAQASFDVPPKELIERVKQVLNAAPLKIGVAEESNGSILTGYQRFPGAFRVARRWQERTRYRINIIPDFDQPAQRARLVVTESTEQRAADGMKWESIDVLPRPERATELLRMIQEQIRAGATTAPGAAPATAPATAPSPR